MVLGKNYYWLKISIVLKGAPPVGTKTALDAEAEAEK